MQTWASLLTSTGDTDRRGNACDCATTITVAKAKALKDNGYDIVGRYLTARYKMTPSELKTIFNSNLRVFPIFETGGFELEHFSEYQGRIDARQAIDAASALGFPAQTIIYFAVDFDAMDHDVTDAIIPYFKGIKDEYTNIGPSKYRIGIYAPRNVCTRVGDNEYSCSSFVCDMSTGFSGNLGYSLPNDWAFDQISTISIGSGNGTIEIDNNICSGIDNGVGIFEIGDGNDGSDDGKLYLNLNPHMKRWGFYPKNLPPVSANVCGYVYPQQNKGISFEILGNPQADIYTIEDAVYGEVNIYAPNDEDSSITSTPLYELDYSTKSLFKQITDLNIFKGAELVFNTFEKEVGIPKFISLQPMITASVKICKTTTFDKDDQDLKLQIRDLDKMTISVKNSFAGASFDIGSINESSLRYTLSNIGFSLPLTDHLRVKAKPLPSLNIYASTWEVTVEASIPVGAHIIYLRLIFTIYSDERFKRQMPLALTAEQLESGELPEKDLLLNPIEVLAWIAVAGVAAYMIMYVIPGASVVQAITFLGMKLSGIIGQVPAPTK